MPGDQARGDAARPVAALALALLLAGCAGGVPQDIDPRFWWRNVSGGYLDGREPPPGRDAPYPNLSTVPARPVPPTAAERAALSAALAADRAGSRTEQLGTAPPVTAGAQPPSPPRLAAVPAIRLDPVTAPRATPAMPSPAAPAAGAPAGVPAAPPPLAPPPLAGPPPAPMGDLLAPPPPPGADLLAPRRN